MLESPTHRNSKWGGLPDATSKEMVGSSMFSRYFNRRILKQTCNLVTCVDCFTVLISQRKHLLIVEVLYIYLYIAYHYCQRVGIYTTHIRVYINICVYIYIYICIYVCMFVCLFVFMHACMHVWMYACMYVCLSVCLYVCMYVRMGTKPLHLLPWPIYTVVYMCLHNNIDRQHPAGVWLKKRYP